ncbi:MAG TPA: hypothetical protein VGP91_04285 [Actinoplanes sp.]|nr:hypothetical protein [Actinoplanes sp.]
MKGFKFEPVAWLTTLAVVLGAVLEADAQYHFLPATWGHWAAVVAAVVGLILVALKARSKVTPLADPKAANGRTLVPSPPAKVPPGTPEQYLDAERG